MSKFDDGGPAFPHLGLYAGADGNLHPQPTQYEGMSYHAWLVGCAVTGLTATEGWGEDMSGAIARLALNIADAVIEEQENRRVRP
jgi:hypothetical protein